MMDSSAAVFSNEGSPFLEASCFQSHYHPSQARPLSQRERSTALSPSRLQQRNRPTSSKEEKTSSPPLLSFLPDSSCQGANPPDSDSASPYNESWPSTERSSSSLTPEGSKTLPLEPTSGTKALASPKLWGSIASFSDSESVIARYIERFRYGQPANRRERQAPSVHSAPFWWLGHSFPSEGDISKMETSSSSSTSRKDVDTAKTFAGTEELFSYTGAKSSKLISPRLPPPPQILTGLERSPGKISLDDFAPLERRHHHDSGWREGLPCSFRPVLDHSASGESQDSSTLDPDTVSLQERAARLLQRSTSTSSSSGHMSSKGLSSTPTSTTTNADADLMGQAWKPLVGPQWKANLGAVSCPIVQISPSSSLRPEDDILFQWRLRRKMEEASKAVSVLPFVGWRSQCTEPAYPPSMMDGAALKSPEPTSWRSKERETSRTSQAQLGLTPDVHPCCCADRMRIRPASHPPTEATSFSDQNVMHGSSELNREQGAKEPVPREDPDSACQDFLPLPRPAGATNPLDLHQSDHSQSTAAPVQKVPSEPRGKQRPCSFEYSILKTARDSAKPSVNPGRHVQRVLGEVIAERLFSSTESPAPQRAKLKRSSKKQGLKVSPPNTIATPSYPELLNMATQLLEQAEESDGTDFEEDPLLQVLRSQRGLLLRQLRAVDTRVAQLAGHHSNQDFSHP